MISNWRRYCPNVIRALWLVFFKELVFHFTLFDPPQIFPDQVFRVGRVVLNLPPFLSQRLMVGAELQNRPV